MTNYTPKFCRVRSCTLPFGHDGNHDGAPTPIPTAVTPRPASKTPRGRRVAGTYKRVTA